MSRDAFELMYPVEAVRCAYERGRAETIQQLRERIEQLPLCDMCGVCGEDFPPSIKRDDVLKILNSPQGEK